MNSDTRIEQLIARGLSTFELVQAGYPYRTVVAVKAAQDAAEAAAKPLPRPCPEPLHLWRRTRYGPSRCSRCYSTTPYLPKKKAA